LSVHKVYVNNSKNPYLLDDEGFLLFNKYTWFATSGNYPYLRTKLNKNGREIVLKFHIELMKDNILNSVINSNTRIIVDHINGNVYDNRKINLRVRTQSENNMNKKIQSNNTSGIVGVSWHAKQKMWNAYITINKKRINLGSFYYFRNAVKARIDAEDKYFGEHAYRLRDEAYNDLINSILIMEDIEEPIFTVRKGKYEVNGISKFRNKYRARLFINGKEISSIHNDLKSAIEWRKEKEIEYYGKLLTFTDEKIDRQI